MANNSEHEQERRWLRRRYLERVEESLAYVSPYQREARAASFKFISIDGDLERVELAIRMARRRGQDCDQLVGRQRSLLSERMKARGEESKAQASYDAAFAAHIGRVKAFQGILDMEYRRMSYHYERETA